MFAYESKNECWYLIYGGSIVVVCGYKYLQSVSKVSEYNHDECEQCARIRVNIYNTSQCKTDINLYCVKVTYI